MTILASLLSPNPCPKKLKISQSMQRVSWTGYAFSFFPTCWSRKEDFKKNSCFGIVGPSMRPEMVGAMNFTIYVPLTCKDGNN